MRCPRILLADDAPEVRALLALVLGRAGADVRLAETGLSALDLAQHADAADAPFDAILLDMEMPVLDGAAAATRLRARGCTAPILAITAHAEPADVDRWLRAGCDEVLAKPIRPAMLVVALARRLAAGILRGELKFEGGVLDVRGVREGMETLAARLAQELPDWARTLEGALAEGDTAAVAALAQRLADVAGSFGFEGVAEAAAELDDEVAAAASLDRVRACVAHVADLCRRAAVARVPLQA